MKRKLFRLIIPAFSSFNIYTEIAKVTTALGPVCIATSASKIEPWDVEVIDENNCRSRLCPKDKEGRPDHEKLQKERPADVVGFYGSLTSTVPRLFQLARLYGSWGVVTVAGGKHIENMPDEALDNGVDIVVFGEGEYVIQDLLREFTEGTGSGIEDVPGIAFRRENNTVKTGKRELITDFSLLPFPNFNLVRYAKIKIYPINRSRGCNMNCEFCAVKDRTRCDTPEHMLAQIKHLVETRKARKFFEVSDHFASDREEAIRFCNMVSEYQKSIGKRLGFTIQTRITDAKYPDLLDAMRRAGVYNICIGYESPIDEELKAMRKGYRSEDMLEWTKEFHRRRFFIHGMFIFGYPKKHTDIPDSYTPLPLKEQIKRFKKFIRKGKIDTAQLLLTIPFPGTDLYKRLKKENRLFPLENIGWEFYDGQFPLYKPDNGIKPEELQKGMHSIMSRFYSINSFFSMIITFLLHFPLIVIPSVFTLVTFKVTYIKSAFLLWKKRFFRNPFLRIGGYITIRNWVKQFKKSNFTPSLKRAWEKMKNEKKKQPPQPA